nr:tetratricopeptide repeat protein 38-like [Haemonchus contortus]
MAAWCADNLRDVEGWRASGLPLSTTSNECAKLLDGAVRQFVSWTDCEQLEGLEKTLEVMESADESAVLPRTFALGVDAIGTGTSARTNAEFRKQLEQLQLDAAKNGNEREQKHAKAVLQFAEGKQSAAARTWEEILKDYPTDLIAIKFAHDTYFYLGDAKNIRDSIKAVLPKHKGNEPCYSYLHGMLAFGLEECEQYAEAEKEALKGLELNRFDCWSTHALAHVLEMQGRFDEGIKFLESTVDDWKPGWMLASHNFWHNALYYLENGNVEVPLEIYDKEILQRAKKSGAMLDIVDAASMLWRLELEGVAVGNRWRDFPDLSTHLDDHALLFNDIHMSMVLREAGGDYGKQEEHLHQTLLQFAENVRSDEYDQARCCREVGIALYDAIAHYSKKEYDDCAKMMLPIRDKIYTIGGSNAQRDMFTQTLIHACMKAKNEEIAGLTEKILNERNAMKNMSKINERLAYRYRELHPM